MKHKIDLDLFIEQAVSDTFSSITIIHTPKESNLDRVSKIAANELIKNWGPELAEDLAVAIKAEMEEQLGKLVRGESLDDI